MLEIVCLVAGWSQVFQKDESSSEPTGCIYNDSDF